MISPIREYAERTGTSSDLAAGGIRTAKQSIDWLILMREELGRRWWSGSVSLWRQHMLADIERQLEFHATGRYSAYFRPSVGLRRVR